MWTVHMKKKICKILEDCAYEIQNLMFGIKNKIKWEVDLGRTHPPRLAKYYTFTHYFTFHNHLLLTFSSS